MQDAMMVNSGDSLAGEFSGGISILSEEKVDSSTIFRRFDIESYRERCVIDVTKLDESGDGSVFGVTVRLRRGRTSRAIEKRVVKVAGHPGEDAVKEHFVAQLMSGSFDDAIRDALRRDVARKGKTGKRRGVRSRVVKESDG